jgi:hypothetical protein
MLSTEHHTGSYDDGLAPRQGGAPRKTQLRSFMNRP